jgi:DNA-binding transcriptional regulator/RsmH inhibitor MraZ
MGRFKNAMKVIGEGLNAMAEHDQKVREMTRKILSHSYGLEYDHAEEVARVLVNHAEVTWK